MKKPAQKRNQMNNARDPKNYQTINDRNPNRVFGIEKKFNRYEYTAKATNNNSLFDETAFNGYQSNDSATGSYGYPPVTSYHGNNLTPHQQGDRRVVYGVQDNRREIWKQASGIKPKLKV